MINETNFIVRLSGRKENSYYIDYSGVYKITDISKLVGIESTQLIEKYLKHNAIYEQNLDVYYFSTLDDAKKTIEDIIKSIKTDLKGRVISLTDAEIEYIRQALINEGVSNLHLSNKTKDAIFRKLNN